MFFGKNERDLVKQVNDELAERVLGQTIAYYPISIEESNFNQTYGEAVEKVSLPPVRVFAYVQVDNEQTNEKYGYEYQSKLTVNFHRRRLIEDQNLFVRVGDFVQYGDTFYEIVKIYNDTRYYFGQVEHKFQVSAECVRARSGAFRVMPGIDRPVDEAEAEDSPSSPAPRPAPYPPLDATYITVRSETRLPNERRLIAGEGVTVTDNGPNSTIVIAASGQNAVGPTGSLQFQLGAGSFSGSNRILFLTSSNTLSLTASLAVQGAASVTSLSASSFVSASLMNLLPTSGTLAGPGSYLGLDANNNLVLSAGDGATTSPGGANTQVQFNNAGAFGGSANLTFDGTTLTGSFSGSLAELTALTASFITASTITVETLVGGSPMFITASAVNFTGSILADQTISSSLNIQAGTAITASTISLTGLQTGTGDGSTSYLAVDANNNIVLTASAGGGGGSIGITSGSTTVAAMSSLLVGQLGLLNSYGSGVVAVTGTIGDPEDGTYTDGLFPAFTSLTRVGVAIDKFNEVLKIIAPTPAPNVRSIGSLTPNGTTAKLSFGASNPVTGYSSSATAAGFDAVARTGSYQAETSGSNIRLAVYEEGQNISGSINNNVNESRGGIYLIYSSGAFGDGDSGDLKLELNGNIIHTASLASFTGAGQPNTGSATSLTNQSGFIDVSISTSSLDSNGGVWNIFQYRTGKYIVNTGSMVPG
jgi:hypothetical protein